MIKTATRLLLILLPLICWAGAPHRVADRVGFTLTSPAFVNGKSIPKVYTCDGKNISPPLQWELAPKNTRSYVLIVDDPDVPKGSWTHWLLFNIPANTNALVENVRSLPKGTIIGNNSWGKNAYDGPCPPKGTHRYYFKLYAIDSLLSVPNKVSKIVLQRAMQGHVITETQLIGTYKSNTGNSR